MPYLHAPPKNGDLIEMSQKANHLGQDLGYTWHFSRCMDEQLENLSNPRGGFWFCPLLVVSFH